MTKISQRATATVVLLLLGTAAFWWLSGREAPAGGTSPAAPNRQEQLWVGTPRRVPGTMLAAQRAASFDDIRVIEDRFAGCPVLGQRQTARIENGFTKISRVRLIRKDDFKYPLIRIEEELVGSAQGDRLTKQTAMVGDHVLVKLQDPKISEATLLAQLKDAGASIRRKMPASGTWLVAFANPTVDTVPQAMARLSALKPWVRYAEPDYIVHAAVTPNDASFDNLWGMNNTGQSAGVEDADIDAPEAWDLSTGSSAVVVAVVDSGIDLTHPDLIDNLWTNPGEIDGNGLDDDANGYVDDTRGWDFVNGDNNPSDDNSHGTHCAGTIGGVGDNSLGVSGVCWDVSLVGLKFLDAAGSGSLSDGIEAIAYATHAGVALTSNSWGGGGFSQAMSDAIDEADAAGVLFIAAAGNDGTNMEFAPGYPASYVSPNVISVAAITRSDTLADYSNYGITTTDLGAPGSEIYSTIPGGGYGIKSGTSMATPHVAGACALLLSYRPGLTHSQVKDLLLSAVDVTPALSGATVSGGRLNLYNALLAADDILATPGTDLVASGPIGGPFTPDSKTYTLTNNSANASNWTASVDRSWVTLSGVSGNLASGASIEIQAALNSETVELLAGDHTATITFTSVTTGRTQLRQVNLRVTPPPVYVFNLDSDPGWARTGAWQYGVPTGQGALLYGKPDPASGATGNQVFGVNLTGDYSTTVASPEYLTAGPFDLSAHHGSTLRFQRWL
ncbi:MAG: S8 family serine peptidase, partial [Prosthecobacter sp.]|nr:S8 family serine peptidase [Prosthecobacter sp.]